MSATTSGKQTGEAGKRAPTAEMIFGRLTSAREAGRNFADRDLGRASPEVRAEVRQRIITVAQVQRFLSLHGPLHNQFRVARHHLKAIHHLLLRERAFMDWKTATCAC